MKVKDPVLPQSLHGEKCNATKRKHIVNDKHYHKGKHQVNGLVYDLKQMPTTDDKKGFTMSLDHLKHQRKVIFSKLLLMPMFQYILNI